jgi:hypothetical protein
MTFVEGTPSHRSGREVESKTRWEVRAYSAATFLANGIFFIYMLRAFRNPHYAEALVNVLPWALAVNVVSSLLFHWFLQGYGRTAKFLLTADLAATLLPMLLLPCLRASAEHLLHHFGLVYAAFVFARCAVLVACAFVRPIAPARTRVWVFVSTALVYVAITPWVTTASWPNGDEHAYLLMMQSLYADHDINLSNNYANGDYKRFFPAPLAGSEGGYPIAAREADSIKAIGLDHHTTLNKKHQEVPWHDVGEPLLLMLGYAIGGKLGATLELNLISAIGALGIFELAFQICGVRSKALWTWALFAFSAPFILYSAVLFPDGIGACLILWAALAALRSLSTRDRKFLLVTGILAAAAPWMSIRFWMVSAPLLAVTGIFLIVEAGDLASKVKDLVALAAPTLISLAVFAWVDTVNYDMLLPNGGYLTYGAHVQHFWTKVHIGVLGLFLDRTYGLLPVAPVYLLSLAGASVALSTQKRLAALLLMPAATYILFVACSRFWYGAGTPPARLITSAAALLAPFASIIIGDRTRWQTALLAAWSWTMSFIMCAVPLTRWYSLWDASVSGMAELFHERWGIDVLSIFPSLLRSTRADQLRAWLWLPIIALAVWWLVARAKTDSPPRATSVAGRVPSEW